MKSYTPILILVLSIGLYFLYIGPTLTEIKSLAVKKAEYDSVLARAEQLAQKRDAVLAEYNSIPAEQISRLNKIIQSDYKSASFINDVNNIAADNRLIVSAARDNSENNSSAEAAIDAENPIPFKTTTVTVNVSGKYADFVEFLRSLESSLHLMDVKSLGITPEGEETVDGIYKFTLEILIYTLN